MKNTILEDSVRGFLRAMARRREDTKSSEDLAVQLKRLAGISSQLSYNHLNLSEETA
ncbi:MAG: hypothetical protein AABX54_04895 [Nanoarchaeota archaeon]